MTTKKKFLFGFALALVGVVVSGAAVMAQSDASPLNLGWGAKKMVSFEDQEKMQEIFKNKDFNAWKELMTEKTKKDNYLTEDNFNRLVESYNTKQAVNDALLKGDYEAWMKAVSAQNPDNLILTKINKENFPRLVEAHKLMQDARIKMEEARKIKTELGIDFKGEMMGGKDGFGHGKMMGGKGGRGGQMMGGFDF